MKSNTKRVLKIYILTLIFALCTSMLVLRYTGLRGYNHPLLWRDIFHNHIWRILLLTLIGSAPIAFEVNEYLKKKNR